VFATTYVPGAQRQCAAQEGEGYAYVLNLDDATAHANGQRIYHLGSGMPAAAVAVGDVILLPGSGIDLYDLDGDGERDVSKLLKSQAQGMYRVYWREPGVDPL
jgi:hypothetical protein